MVAKSAKHVTALIKRNLIFFILKMYFNVIIIIFSLLVYLLICLFL